MRIPALMSIGALVLVTACGGKSSPRQPTPDPGDDGEVEASGGDVIPPERMDEIKALMDRKRTSAARCLADAVNAGKVPKNTRGHVALEFTIGTSGAAQGMKIIETSIDAPGVEACIMEKVQQIDFGALPAPLEWSYTYAFESM